MQLRVLIFFTLFLIISACAVRTGEQAVNTSSSATATPAASPTPVPTAESTPEEKAGRSATLECQNVKTGERKVYKKQTFAIDFEPFKGSCFVSTYDPEYGDDPPLQSEYAIYKNGRKVFDFPAQFNGVNFGCWIEAVSFQDLNSDKRNDVIVIGRCSGKSETYNESSVYINDGSGFTTREDANVQLNEFSKIAQVADFVKENPRMFY